MALFHKADNCILDDLGVHLERWDVRVSTKLGKYGVSDITYTGLDREERCRDTTYFDLCSKEVGNVFTDFCCYFINSGKTAYFVLAVGMYYAENFLRVYLYVRFTTAVRRFVYRDSFATRRVERLVDIVHSTELCRVCGIELYNDMVCKTADGWEDTDT